MSSSQFRHEVELADGFEVKEDYKNAFRHYKKALAFDPNDEYSMIQIVRMRYLESDVRKVGLSKSVQIILNNAKTLSNRALKKYPKNVDAIFIQSLIYKGLGKHADAITCLKKASKILPNNYQIIFEMAENYSWINQYKKAISCFDLLLKLSPRNIDILFEKGKCFSIMQKHQETLDICDEILKIDSSAQQFFLRAYSLLELKRYDDAVEMCDKVLAKNGYDLFALCFKVDALYNLKKFKDAIKVSDQIKPWNEGEHIGEKAFFLDALIDKGRCLERLDRFKEAEKVFLDALKKSKNEVEPKNNALEALGHVNWIQGEHKKARKYFLQFTKEDRKKAIFIAKNSNRQNFAQHSLIDTGEGLEKLLSRDESKTLEFKSSLCHPYKLRKEQRNDQTMDENKARVTETALKTICAFLNTDGGSLVIGIEETEERPHKKHILGIEEDFKHIGNRQNWDGWKNYLQSKIKDRIGTEFSPYINIVKEESDDGKKVAIIRVKASENNAYLDPKIHNKCSYYTRTSDGSEKCDVRTAVNIVLDKVKLRQTQNN
jgi:tetratricopeptide (TPR) repeat protein